jgi:formate dehydrogenase beta subunit
MRVDSAIEQQVDAASCVAACPVQTDTRLYVELITQGKYEDALELLLKANPFSSVCGRICHHPCEQKCRRNRVDAPVGLRLLKRFIMESTGDYRLSRRKRMEPTRSERIAIIGSGPGGLTAAHDLAERGFAVVVYEKWDTPGGMLGTTIPRYRLPYEVLREDIDDVLSLGVELQTGCEIGRDLQIEDLRNEGFAAILIATGLPESRTLGVPGIDSAGVLLAIPFLRAVSLGESPPLGSRVVVIGGGNVAFDVARCARRLGSDKVTLVSLESQQEMPAWEWEIEEARQEGVDISNSLGPKAVFSEDGVLRGIELKKCTAVFDNTGRFNPRFDERDVSTLLADSIILAIGQRSDLRCIAGSAVKAAGDRLEFDPETLATTEPGIFACGEVVTGPGAAVEAVREGHRAARAILHYLDTGELLKQPVTEPPSLGDIPFDTAEKIKRREPIVPELAPAEKRVKDFSEIERGFTEAEALAEAKRCLACTTGALADEEKCAACLTCVRICPFGVAQVERTAVMPQEQCQACGLCAAECPAAAIALKRFGTNRMRKEIGDFLPRMERGEHLQPLIVSYCCLFEVTSRKLVRAEPSAAGKTGVARVMVPCVARLSVVDILAPFELGADGVVIISCTEGDCLYPTAEERLSARVHKAKGILDEIGLGGERIDHWRTEGSAEVSWSAFWEISKRKLAALDGMSPASMEVGT